MKLIFWVFLFAVFYTYAGYAIILFFLTLFKKKVKSPARPEDDKEWPEVCLFVTAYNEKNILAEKISNCLSLDYPKEKLKIVFVTDGSDDGSHEYLMNIPDINVYHESERKGKINAMNRGMTFITSPIVIFTDANTNLNKESVKIIANEFFDPNIGCIAGRKKVLRTKNASASETGEGLYWKYESWLKTMDSKFNMPIGAVGELFAIRTELFEPVAKDTILDDFIISFNILDKGYKLKYVPDAIASENASLNVSEELKRKIRIAAGGIQTAIRLRKFLNPFRYPKLSFQFFSHKISRWTYTPWLLFSMLPLNLLIVIFNSDPLYLFTVIFILQSIIYVVAFLGWIFEKIKIHLTPFFIPYYFIAINLATIRGQFRYFSGKQKPAWERAKRL